MDVAQPHRPQVSDGLSLAAAWLHVTVRERSAASASSNRARSATTASIAGNDNDADAAAFEPHYDEITAPDQVQIYEPILGDRDGMPTTGLLTATQYLKDNRLLPRGFDKATAGCGDRRLRRGAKAIADFAGGGDRVRYRDRRLPASGPFTSRSSCATSRSAIAGRTISSATTRRSRSAFSRTIRRDRSGSSVLVAAARAVSP